MEQPSPTREFFETLATRIDPAKLAGENASYRFVIDGAGSWRVDLADGGLAVTAADDGGDCVIRMNDETFGKLLAGRQNPVTGFMTGKIKIDGDMSLAMKLKDLFF